jgi:hypothetical protein
MAKYLFLIVQLVLVDHAWAGAGKKAEAVPSIFRGVEVVAEPLAAKKKSRPISDVKLDDKISQQLTQYGVSIYNVKSHGMNQQDYVEAKAKSRFQRLYLDVIVTKKEWSFFPFRKDDFSFDIVYAKGSDFFPESEPEVIHGCKGKQHGDIVELKIDECIQKHLNGA